MFLSDTQHRKDLKNCRVAYKVKFWFRRTFCTHFLMKLQIYRFDSTQHKRKQNSDISVR